MQVVSICVELLCGLAGKTNVIGVCGNKRGPNYSVWVPSLCIQLLGFNYKCLQHKTKKEEDVFILFISNCKFIKKR
jgi:hypothetical protein